MQSLSEKRESLKRLRALKVQKRKRKGLNDLYYFNKSYLENWVQKRVHKPMCDTVCDRNNKRILLLAPRDHHKSTNVTSAYTTQQIIKDTNHRILLINATHKNAKNFLRRVKSNLKKKRVIEDYGRFDQLSDTWNESTIILPRTKALAEPTVEAVGVGGDIVSEHVDTIIIDDICNFTNTRTHSQRQKVIEWFLAVLDIITPDGQIIVVGTRWHPEDLYGFILKNLKKRFKNWKPIVEKAFMSNGEVWFNDKFTKADLDLKKEEKGYVLFLAQYMNDITGLEDRIFKSHWIKLYKTAPKSIEMIAQGLDLAITSEKRMREENIKKADWTAEGTIGLTPDKDIYILHIWKARIGYTEQKKRILDTYKMFNAHKIGIESNGYQRAIAEDIIDTSVLPVVAIPSTESKEARARRLSVLFEQGKVYIHESMTELIEDLIYYPDRNLDVIDAIGKAVEVVELKKKALFIGEV